MNYLTDEQVEQEIERLRNSPYVALARKEQYVRCQRRQALYSLRHLEKKGKSLAASGITMDMLDASGQEGGHGCHSLQVRQGAEKGKQLGKAKKRWIKGATEL